jgi:ABC-2 type transport system permease protein
MSLSLGKALIIARREYITTVRRKAFILSLLLTPAILFVSGFLSTKLASDDARRRFAEARIVAVVDSAGLYRDAALTYQYQPNAEKRPDPTNPGLAPGRPRPIPVILRPYRDQAVALDSLREGHVKQVLVVGSDFLESGRLRLYEHDTRVFTGSADDRPLRFWLTRSLLAGLADSARIERVLHLGRAVESYTLDRQGQWAVKDDARELVGFLLPFALGFLLSMAIVTGGQYLLQGVSEEKESRILESLLCTVSPDELLVGKLMGLGSAGLTLVGVWVAAGTFAALPMLTALDMQVPPSLILASLAYFLVGYLFYASLMTGIGAITSNLREATQFSAVLTMLNFVPFWLLVKILNSPNSGFAMGLSFFPPTAATTMMLRLSAASVSGARIAPWEVAASLAVLALAAAVGLMIGSRMFRLGMLLYGKAPNLPEIMRLLRHK